jgi:hypothetical protein
MEHPGKAGRHAPVAVAIGRLGYHQAEAMKPP